MVDRVDDWWNDAHEMPESTNQMARGSRGGRFFRWPYRTSRTPQINVFFRLVFLGKLKPVFFRLVFLGKSKPFKPWLMCFSDWSSWENWNLCFSDWFYWENPSRLNPWYWPLKKQGAFRFQFSHHPIPCAFRWENHLGMLQTMLLFTKGCWCFTIDWDHISTHI